MGNIYKNILEARAGKRKLLAVLLDPDKLKIEEVGELVKKINESPATHIFIGGSSFAGNHLDELITLVKKNTNLPTLIFPGSPLQISDKADGILFLMLLSGRNPEYLIEHQVNSVPVLEKTNLEVISTGYILIESGSQTAVERVSKTQPLSAENHDYVSQTAKAGELIGNKLIYLEAGSGAANAVPLEMIGNVSGRISVPLIVGGGIRTFAQMESAYLAGADMVVIGTAFENDPYFFERQTDENLKLLNFEC